VASGIFSAGVKIMKTIALITGVLIVSMSMLSTAEAAPPSDVPAAIDKLRDLDITRPAGKQDLYRRLIRAARAVCSPGDWPDKARVTPEYEECVDEAVSDVVARFNRAEFSDYVAAQSARNRVHLADR